MGTPVFAEVVVRARLASEARVAAAEMEARRHGYAPVRNHAALEATAFPSAFFDEKAYHVERIAEDDEGDLPRPADGLDAVVIAMRLADENDAGNA